jgi:hypothetical protein
MLLVLKSLWENQSIIEENNLFIFEAKTSPLKYLDADSS